VQALFQPTSTCQAGVCNKPATVNCDDGLECTVDACNATSGCSKSNKPWGTACTNSALSYAFCAGSLCTGLEKVSAQVGGGSVSNGALFAIDRYGGTGGKVYSAGADTSSNPLNGIVANVVESPQLGLQFNAAINSNSALLAQRNRLTVGGRSDDSQARAMVLNPVTGFWTTTGAPVLTGFERSMRGMDMFLGANSAETYVMGGNQAGGGTPNQIGRTTWDGSAWSTIARMTVSSSKANCAQINVNVRGVYAASGTEVFLTGHYTASNANRTGVAFWDGNTTATCGNASGYNGVAYVDTTAYTQSFSAVVNTGAVPAMGQLTSVHGTGGKNVMAAGTHGTIVAYDGAKWSQVTPAYTGMPLAWSNGFTVGSVYLTGSEAWLTGTVETGTGGSTCRQLWLLHGTVDKGVWTWNKQIVSANNDLAVCSNESSVRAWMQANAVWVDPATGSVYVVGSRGANGSNVATVNNPSRQVELLVRVKMK